MMVIDSSLWLEYIAGSESGKKIYNFVDDYDEIILPVIVIYEVVKRVAITDNQIKAFKLIDYFNKYKIANIDTEIIIESLHYSLEYKLPLADSIIYATAKHFNATLLTSDKHFEGLKDVRYYQK